MVFKYYWILLVLQVTGQHYNVTVYEHRFLICGHLKIIYYFELGIMLMRRDYSYSLVNVERIYHFSNELPSLNQNQVFLLQILGFIWHSCIRINSIYIKTLTMYHKI